MGENGLKTVLNAHSGRLVGDGVAATDLQAISKSINDLSEWFDAWAQLVLVWTADSDSDVVVPAVHGDDMGGGSGGAALCGG